MRVFYRVSVIIEKIFDVDGENVTPICVAKTPIRETDQYDKAKDTEIRCVRATAATWGAEPERTAWDDAYDRAERSDAWERRGGGGL